MIDTDHQSAAVVLHVVDAVGNGDAAGIGAEVVIENAACLLVPALARVLEVAYQLALLGVDADDGKVAALKLAADIGQVLELLVAVWAGTAGNHLGIDVKRVAHLMQELGYGVGRNHDAEST